MYSYNAGICIKLRLTSLDKRLKRTKTKQCITFARNPN